jgi:hypothetical protein
MEILALYPPLILDIRERVSVTRMGTKRLNYVRSLLRTKRNILQMRPLGASDVNDIRTVTLGSSDLEVSEVCMGTMVRKER